MSTLSLVRITIAASSAAIEGQCLHAKLDLMYWSNILCVRVLVTQ